MNEKDEIEKYDEDFYELINRSIPQAC